MAKKWGLPAVSLAGKAVRKIKDGLHQKADALKSQITNNPIKEKQEHKCRACKVTPDVCIVRQTRRAEECLSCQSFVR